MWNVYDSTVLFYSWAGKALNIVSIESGTSERAMKSILKPEFVWINRI